MEPDELAAHVRSFIDYGLMLDPWLGGTAEKRIDPEAERRIREAAEGFAARYWVETPAPQAVGAASAHRVLGYDAALATLLSTSAVIAHDRVGHIAVSQEMAEEALRRVGAFIATRGFQVLVWVYLIVSRCEHLGALQYYGSIPEDDFVRGRHRRPWVDTPLDLALERGVADGHFQVVTRQEQRRVEPTPQEQRRVEPTPQGLKFLNQAREVLAAAGFFEARLRIALFSELNLIPDYEAVTRRLVPREVEWRRTVTAFFGLQPGMHVLNVGCTTGVQIFEGGLLEAVGPSGSVTGVCPSVVLADQARAKAEQRQAANVRVVRSYLEELPFADGSFDASVGVGMLHRTDAPRAIAEMARVTRAGGIVAHGTQCELEAPPKWIGEWLAPVLSLAGTRPFRHPHARPRKGEVAGWLAAAGLVGVWTEPSYAQSVFDDPEATSVLALRTDPVIQDVLGGLPWPAAQQLIEEITQRAKDIFPKLTLEERLVAIPVELVRGRVPGPR